MAVKKTVKKAAKAAKPAAKKVAKAAPKKAAVKKPAAKKAAPTKATKAPAVKKAAAAKKAAPAKAAVKKAAVKKAPAKKAAVKKVAPVKPVAKTSTSKAPAKATKPAVAKKPAVKTPAVKKPAPAKVAPAKAAPAKAATPKPAPAPKKSSAKKASAKPSTKVAPVPATRQAPPRTAGKVAVAVTNRPAQAPAPKTRYKTIPHKTDEATGRPILPKGYRPDPEEEYMSPLQLEYFRQRLLDWRADLVDESKQTIENLKDEVRDVGDDAERATRETENSLELRTRDRYRKLIGKIDSTLKRVDSGEYGFSVDSGEEIGLDRLEARLTAERTIDEQERWEHLQKQMGD